MGNKQAKNATNGKNKKVSRSKSIGNDYLTHEDSNEDPVPSGSGYILPAVTNGSESRLKVDKRAASMGNLKTDRRESNRSGSSNTDKKVQIVDIDHQEQLEKVKMDKLDRMFEISMQEFGIVPEKITFTASQKNSLKKAWAHARFKGSCEPGLSILYHATIKCPTFRPLFTFEMQNEEISNISEGMNETRCSEAIKRHAVFYTELMDLAVLQQDSIHDIDGHIRDIGRKHAALKGVGLGAKEWDVLATSALDLSVTWGDRSVRNRETQAAWTNLLLHVTKMLKEGFDAELRRRRRSGRKYVRQLTVPDLPKLCKDNQKSRSSNEIAQAPTSTSTVV